MCDRENRIKGKKRLEEDFWSFFNTKVYSRGCRWQVLLYTSNADSRKKHALYEEWIRESELQIKVFDCTQRAVIGWKGKEK